MRELSHLSFLHFPDMIPLTSTIPPHFPRASLHYLHPTLPCPFSSPPRRRLSAMPIGDSPTPLRQSSLPFELKDKSDFDQIVSSDELVSVCGFGSLLSGSMNGSAERSARSTFPDLINFRIAKLNGFRRVFAHAAPIFFERGIAKPETKVVFLFCLFFCQKLFFFFCTISWHMYTFLEISSLSVEPCESETLIVTTFEIQKSEIPAFIEREHEFRFLAVIPETLNGLFYTTPAVLCARYSDEEYFLNRCKGSEDILFQRYGKYGITKIWMDDILPCRAYLRHCVLAAKNLSDMAYDNFLDHTFLGDRSTTIREYLATSGSGIMEEEPPEDLKHRYGG
ncbi:hypothetical protein SASPL_140089 [Salvia splendens]|uniref:Uncharacterized protein n=1 Tax=Salvia splendens TaxID=180675 RepID=A0A8X8ZB14_SALSN|nr:hypothetical protein SASPL_140089 [Salvia splendens]